MLGVVLCCVAMLLWGDSRVAVTAMKMSSSLSNFGSLNRFGWSYVESRCADANFMDLAYMLARNSQALDGHMGCCCVRDDKEVLVEAINSPLYGEGRSDVHAEASAICGAARRGLSLEGCSLYVTRAPCSRCYSLIAFAGISKIVAPTRMEQKDVASAALLGIEYVCLRDDEERSSWRSELAERYRDDDEIRAARERRKTIKQQRRLHKLLNSTHHD